MSKSQRRPQQIFSIVMWMLSIIFAACLMGIGGLIIKDLPQVDQNLSVEQFTDRGTLIDMQNRENKLQSQVLGLNRSLEDKQQSFSSTQVDYLSAKSSFENWIKTRNATQSSGENPEVLSRTRQLESLKSIERTAFGDVELARKNLKTIERSLTDVRAQQNNIISAARPAYRSAKRLQELRVFLYRLALTLPLLIIAGWVATKQRESAYWPLYRGFILFALFAFFVELVPYLPSYGGYVRYSVGIIIVLVSGHFIIRGMRHYIERKQVEEARSESVRRQSIQYETALKKIAAKTCPGCDRSIVQREGVNTDFCVHCGIRLQRKCGGCGHRNISFHKFCLSCGIASPESEAPETLAPESVAPKIIASEPDAPNLA